MENPEDWFLNLPKCDRCGQRYGGSHYHCGGCDSLDVTSMYGHHHGSGDQFHHCPPGDVCPFDTVKKLLRHL